MTAPSRWFFGYGSLVNDHTLAPDTQWQAATLRHWHRSWGHAIPRDPPWFALNARPDEGSTLDGLLIRETPDTAAQLAARESGYSAHPLNADDLNVSLKAGDSAWIWVSDTPAAPSQVGCLCQSYIDCVLAGFTRHFGERGVTRFIDTTDGWDHPLIADRGSPRYPRAVTLTPEAYRRHDHCVEAARRAESNSRGQ